MPCLITLLSRLLAPDLASNPAATLTERLGDFDLDR
jgi:hypothetical protein